MARKRFHRLVRVWLQPLFLTKLRLVSHHDFILRQS
ncbi:Uncharacterised protein [Vibrio cholerae]|nr:Uncharacterised protein [Vibrio cholerae]